MKRLVTIYLLLIGFGFNLQAQYIGGNGHGLALLSVNNRILGEFVYTGGSGNGYTHANSLSQTIGFTIFIGGLGSGTVSDTISQQLIGFSNYLGGTGAGFSVQLIDSQYIGLSYYLGGYGHGTDNDTISQQYFGDNIYYGGTADGFTTVQSIVQLLGQNICFGGIGDGESASTSTNNQMGENLYTGGTGDGWSMIMENNASLPVTLLKFSGEWKGPDINLTWVSTNEINNFQYRLLRLNDNTTEDCIATINSFPNSNTYKVYNFIDTTVREYPFVKTFYYQLMQTDLDGKQTRFQKIALSRKLGNVNEAYIIYPNPSLGEFRLVHSANNHEKVTITLYNEIGANLLEKETTIPIALDLTTFSAGFYHLKITPSNGDITYLKLIKQ